MQIHDHPGASTDTQAGTRSGRSSKEKPRSSLTCFQTGESDSVQSDTTANTSPSGFLFQSSLLLLTFYFYILSSTVHDT